MYRFIHTQIYVYIFIFATSYYSKSPKFLGLFCTQDIHIYGVYSKDCALLKIPSPSEKKISPDFYEHQGSCNLVVQSGGDP